MSAPPPRPRLDGDDRAFVRFDPATGEILSHGHQRRDHIAAEAAAGAAILQLEVGHEPISTRTHRVNLRTGTIERVGPPEPQSEQTRRAALDRLVREQLQLTDHYMLADALDNVTEAEQAGWQQYRRALRAAAQSVSLDEMLSKLPPTDPKGADRFYGFRSI